MTILSIHAETYKLPNGESCRCVANFEDETIRIMSRGFNKEFSLDDYSDFEGNMKEFALHVMAQPECGCTVGLPHFVDCED